MKCPLCNEELMIEDRDYKFEGNEDIYANCYHCHHSLIIYIRFNKIWKCEYQKMIFDKKWGWVCDDNEDIKTIIVNSFKKGQNEL